MFVVSAAVSGCGVVPAKVEYKEYATTGESSFGYPFRHRRSVLLVRYDNDSKAFTAVASPHELDAEGKYLQLYQITGVDNLKSTTQLKVSYVDNTKILDKLDLTTKDNVGDTINKIGNVAAAVAPALAGVVAGEANAAAVSFNPTVLDPAVSESSTWQQDKANPTYCMRLQNVIPEQGVTLDAYMKARVGGAASDFPVSSCVSAVVELGKCDSVRKDGDAVRVPVTFASPDRVTPMPLPSSGSLKMNSVCGATVTEADKQDRHELTDYLISIMDNVKKVQAAKAKK